MLHAPLQHSINYLRNKTILFSSINSINKKMPIKPIALRDNDIIQSSIGKIGKLKGLLACAFFHQQSIRREKQGGYTGERYPIGTGELKFIGDDPTRRPPRHLNHGNDF